MEASQGAGTSEEVFQSIFNTRSYAHMRAVFDSYKEIADGKEIEETIESEFSGNMQTAYLALGNYIIIIIIINQGVFLSVWWFALHS